MIADQRQHTPLTRRKAIDRLLQLREKSTGRKRKAIRKWIAKLAADQVRVLNVPAAGEKERRLANIRRREQLDNRILAKRDPVAYTERKRRRMEAAGVVKPVFE